MRCTVCSHENRPGVKFCEQCGTQMQVQAAENMGKFCPSCGQALRSDSKFCESCGKATGIEPVQAAPVVAPIYVAAPPQRRGIRGCIWPFIGVFSGLLLICGLMFYLTLIRIPPIPNTASTPQMIKKTTRVLRIIQQNMNPPLAAVGMGDQVYGNPSLGVVVVDLPPGEGNDVDAPPPGTTLPSVCGPKLELELKEVSTIKPFGGGFAGTWGSGPTVYEFANTGESMSASEYGYFAIWEISNIDKEKIYSCSGWETNSLTCFGPALEPSDLASVFIYSENPGCSTPSEVFIAQSEPPYVLTRDGVIAIREDICEPVGSFTHFGQWEINGVESSVYNDHGNPEISDGRYYQVIEYIDPVSGKWNRIEGECFNKQGALTCFPFVRRYTHTSNEDGTYQYPDFKWGLYQRPADICTQPIYSEIRKSSSIAAEEPEEPQACVPEVIQSKLSSFHLKMIGRDPGWQPNFENPFAVHLPSGISDDDMKSLSENITAVYDIRNPDGSKWTEQNRFGCDEPNLFAIPCGYAIYDHGQFVRDDQSVTMQVFYKDSEKDCEELLLEKFWPAIQVAQPPAQPVEVDRCSLFEDVSMSVTYLDWVSGAPLQFYFKMLGGVPGLEKKILGDSDSWDYSATIGDYRSSKCFVYKEAKERLYCTISLPSGYSNALRPMTLSVNGCNSPIYRNQTAFLPAIEGSSVSAGEETSGDDASSSGGSGGSDDLGGDVCGPEPADSGSGEWSDWCSCRWDNDLSC